MYDTAEAITRNRKITIINEATCSVPVRFTALAGRIDPQLKHQVLHTLHILQLFPMSEQIASGWTT